MDSTMAECGPRLLPLATCASFVQGSAPSPTQSCCANLIELYGQQPSCLCLLLSDTSGTNFPINRTLALELPNLCNLRPNLSDCPGLNLTPGSLESHVFHGTTNGNTSSLTVSPSALPPNTNLSIGLGKSVGTKLKCQGDIYAYILIASLFMKVLLLF
ncbi:Bifunctional inhibitor/lipid-transfer protein/seed storage 2S albumin superfamily protein [Thalictrum thalictroides]|uniref:Bifunctional inhibitor/lipid-transfer protein/seed storage 2S albumin superfamily protein n=1 Tax=Thalictrum thalictroides TaxID=46969 RepID=A0A7J6VNX5_THATH|nr:Bifunctional inhibitor/lipid-transfer protein/seed storage 2S albumin superfamily protein [Thalictrum thalictroides]